jgi:hypothetical protein
MDILGVSGAFANADKTVVNWEGRNYYQACGEPVVVVENTEDGHAGTSCVKRIDHPGDIHEDYDGVRTTPNPTGRIAVVVSFPVIEDLKRGHQRMQDILQTLKPVFGDQPEVKVQAGIREMADQVILILDGDG